MSLFLALLVLAPAAAAAPTDPALVSGPVKMKPSQIREYNASLSPDHPNYIRCVTETVTGTLARKVKTCRTNQDWERVGTVGNDAARGIVEPAQRGFTNGVPGG
jgi:hypothetical protein